MKIRALGLLFATTALPLAALAHEHTAAGRGPSVASVDACVDRGVIHLLIGEDRPGEKARALFYRRSADDGATWSPPARVDSETQPAFPAHVGGDAQIAAHGDRLVAAWTGFGTGWGGSGPIATAFSIDGGRTWAPGGRPGDAGPSVAQGFIDLLAGPQGVDAVWLDSRDKSQGLRHARSVDGGKTWSAPTTVAARTCECCTNRLTRDAHGALHVLYRGKAPRDMRLGSTADGTWHAGTTVGSFDWAVDACPHTGGALATDAGGALHAFAWTGRDDMLGLYRLRSEDAGRSWSTPRRVGADSARHADLAASSEGTLAAVWDEQRGAGHAVLRAMSRDGGTTWSAPEPLSSTGVDAQRPRVVATQSGFVTFWVQRTASGAQLMANGVALPDAASADGRHR